MIYNMSLEDHLAGECMLWPILWVPKVHDDWGDTIVPYVEISRRSRVRRKPSQEPNLMLRLCRASPAIALDPELGRYASLPVRRAGDTPWENDPRARWDDDGYIIVRPCRDVFTFRHHGERVSQTVLV